MPEHPEHLSAYALLILAPALAGVPPAELSSAPSPGNLTSLVLITFIISFSLTFALSLPLIDIYRFYFNYFNYFFVGLLFEDAVFIFGVIIRSRQRFQVFEGQVG
jgi:hypothetical protein